jgi:hypothetical protein
MSASCIFSIEYFVFLFDIQDNIKDTGVVTVPVDLNVCFTWSRTLRKEYRPRYLENVVLEKIV